MDSELTGEKLMHIIQTKPNRLANMAHSKAVKKFSMLFKMMRVTALKRKLSALDQK